MKRPLNVSGEVKRAAVKRVAAGEPVSKVASDLKIDRRRLYEWQEQARRGGFPARRKRVAEIAENAEIPRGKQ